MDIGRLTSRRKEDSPAHKGWRRRARQPEHDQRQEVRADHPLCEFAIGQELTQGCGQSVDIAGYNVHAGVAVLDDFRWTAGVGGHDGRAAHHGFRHHIAERLFPQ